MQRFTRREFIAKSTIATAGLAGVCAFGRDSHHFRGPYGVQMYSIREEMKTNPDAALKMVRSLGYTEIEAWEEHGVDAGTLKPKLDAAGLRATGMHTDYNALSSKLSDVMTNAHSLGSEWVVCAWVDENRRKTLQDYQNLAKQFNDFGRQFHDSGLRFGYHNHTVEFVRFNNRPALDTLIEQTDPKLVWFELDIGHVGRSGADPAAYIEKYPNRIRLLHLKDIRPKPGVANPGPDDYVEVVMGQGTLPLAKILRAAEKAGVERYYVEEEAGDVENRLRQDYQFLKRVVL